MVTTKVIAPHSFRKMLMRRPFPDSAPPRR
jgi:hypothetical protein